MWRVLLASRLRAQTSYRASFALDLFGNLGIALLEFTELWVIFANVKALGGLSFAQTAVVFAFANIAFSLADLIVGHVDELPRYIRAGTLDAFLVRPASVLGQLITSDISPKRITRTLGAVAVFIIAIAHLDIAWTPLRIWALISVPIFGTAIFAALFVTAAGLQFWLIDGAEVTNAFTYGGSYVASYPASLYQNVLRTFFTFVMPAIFTAYLPALVIFGESGPAGLPAWLGLLTPLMAGISWGVALGLWRLGLRHYTGAGS
ncbi:MAG: ABC transporter permease [Actinobacteria bacterium]|nr:ABC transporter permease [Actinomycetota bacterium]